MNKVAVIGLGLIGGSLAVDIKKAFGSTILGIDSNPENAQKALEIGFVDEISTIEIKKILQEIVNDENKSKPLSDIELSEKLSEKGYKVARRTVSKYRENLDISVARLRKEL